MTQDLMTHPEKQNPTIKQAHRSSVNYPYFNCLYPIKDDEEPIAKSSI